jgi:hypothetical protein
VGVFEAREGIAERIRWEKAIEKRNAGRSIEAPSARPVQEKRSIRRRKERDKGCR